MAENTNRTPMERDRQRDYMRAKRHADRQIEIANVVDQKRKQDASRDLFAFADFYFSRPPNRDLHPDKKAWISWSMSDAHRHVVRDMQDIILFGGNEAVVAPRGFGKDTWGEIGLIWGALYGHIPFGIFACYKMEEAKSRISEIRTQIEINEWLAEDFPEVVGPVRALERSAQRGRQQMHDGEFTHIEWGDSLIKLPVIAGSAASGNIIKPASLNGSIRGAREDGKRPTYVIISDPQTRDTAKSLDQTEEIMSTINADFGGLGSHEESCSFLALMTIIKKGDVAEQLTDRKLNPAYRGIRYRAVSQWPDGYGNANPQNNSPWGMWLNYMDMRKSDQQNEPPTRNADDYYLANQAKMDDGFNIYWDIHIQKLGKDGRPTEYSGQQHIMNLYCDKGEDFILTEMQNDPPEKTTIEELNEDEIIQRMAETTHMVAPVGSRLVRTVDLQGRRLQMAVVALMPDFSGVVIDYSDRELPGAISKDIDIRRDTMTEPMQQAIEMAIEAGLTELRDEELSAPYVDSSGQHKNIEMTLIDSGYMPEAVYRFVRASGAKFRAIKGDGYYRMKPNNNIQIGDHYLGKFDQVAGCWIWHLDVDSLKHAVHARFRQAVSTPGAFKLFGPENIGEEQRILREHRGFARGITAEVYDPEKGKWIKRRANHPLDLMVYAVAAGEMIGIKIGRPVQAGSAKPRQRVVSAGKQFWNHRRR